MNEKTILFDVLNIIDYKDDKIAFVDKFFSYIYIEAIAEITTQLSPEEQKKLGDELQKAQDEEAQKAAVLRYLSKEAFDKRLTAITQAQFSDYLDTIYPTLTKEKQEELNTYLSTLTKPDNVL